MSSSKATVSYKCSAVLLDDKSRGLALGLGFSLLSEGRRTNRSNLVSPEGSLDQLCSLSLESWLFPLGLPMRPRLELSESLRLIWLEIFVETSSELPTEGNLDLLEATTGLAATGGRPSLSQLAIRSLTDEAL